MNAGKMQDQALLIGVCLKSKRENLLDHREIPDRADTLSGWFSWPTEFLNNLVQFFHVGNRG